MQHPETLPAGQTDHLELSFNPPPSLSKLSAAACSSCDEAGNVPAVPDVLPSYIYALGRVEARFPRISVEKEFAQVAGRSAHTGKPEREMFHAVLSMPEHRYLLRHLCWILIVQGLETYLLTPGDPADLGLLLDAIRPRPHPLDIDAVIGTKGPLAPPDLCNGLMIPVVTVDQIYSFDRDTLIKAIPRPEGSDAKTFESSATELFDRVMQVTDNAGSLDSHRALNYLAVRYPAIYTSVADAHVRNSSLTGVEVRPSNLGVTRKVVDVILTFTNRNNEFVDKSFVRVDVTDEFPFLVTRLSPYYDH